MNQGIVDVTLGETVGYRLINSKFPPIALFDDVASEDEFEILYACQALTNPRLQSEVGNLNLLPKSEWPFGIAGCSYAVAPFTHVNPDGSRFSTGQFGMLYIADSVDTALKEVAYHQQNYWRHISGLEYDRFVFRCLFCEFHGGPLADLTSLPIDHAIYASDNYMTAQAFGAQQRVRGALGIQYLSVRNPASVCWGLFTPKTVTSIKQTSHYQMIWDGSAISSMNKLTGFSMEFSKSREQSTGNF